MQPNIRFDHTVVALQVEGTVHVMVELTAPEAPATQRLPIDAVVVLRQIEPGGSTNLSGGWLKALEVLNEQARPGALTRIVLLTDGQANHGIIDQDRLATMAGAAAGNGVSTSCIGFGADVVEQVLVLRAAREQAEAHREIERGNYERAATLLGDAADKLGGSALPEHDRRVRELRDEVERLTVGNWANESSKRLFSTSRSTSRGRKSRFDADEEEGKS